MNRADTMKSFQALIAGALLATTTFAAAETDKPAADYDAPKATVGSPEAAAAPAATAQKRAAAKHWAYQPVALPATPATKHADWVISPIDAFVLAKLEAKNLAPSPAADRATYIRRATLDTWGVLPTPAEVEAFKADRSKDAYEKLIDRLLASPQYGERWARHWLDLARHADSDGYNADGTRPNMWRYRDYVVDALNSDKPFDLFVKEQLAGDELFPNDLDAQIATGFLRNYPDEINARDLNLKKTEIATDLADTVSNVFLATTAGCARCHDHKFDRISQKDYYSFQAFFQNTSARDDLSARRVPLDEAAREKQKKYQAATKAIRAEMDKLLEPTIDKLESDRVLGFTPATRESITKPTFEQDAYDRWIYQRSLWTMVGRTRNAENVLKKKDPEAYDRYTTLKESLKKYDNLKPEGAGNISTVFETGPDSPDTYVLHTGIYDRPVYRVEPALIPLLGGEKAEIVATEKSSGRRTALAKWIASPSNPLTARVFVNRIWAQYFDHGISDTVSDFGRQSEKPVNPELLDYLAWNFAHDWNWSIKRLQREVLLSATYRQSSAERAEALEVDPDNRLLANFPRKRLEAEQIRDSLLAASGLLDTRRGGPSVFPAVPANFGKTVNANAWTVSEDPRDRNRRSLYVFTRRNTAYPLFEAFDMANPNIVHEKRTVTTTAPQALALLNSELAYEWSATLAGRVREEVGPNEAEQIERVYEILFARAPTRAEKATLKDFLAAQEKVVRERLLAGAPVLLPDGYRETPQVAQGLDAVYRELYGRTPDRIERAQLFAYLDGQQKKHAALASNNTAGPANDDGDGPTPAAADAAKPASELAADPKAARAVAFVDLVHALANSNEFIYRF
jgi:hypothetical protein